MTSEGVQLVYYRILGYIHWVAFGTQLWSELSVEKRQNGGRLIQKALRVPLPLQWSRFLRGGDGSGHFRSSSERIWKSIWNEPKIIAWTYWPYIHAEGLLLACAGTAKQCPPTVPTGKA